jgi:uncharacterized membrane protein
MLSWKWTLWNLFLAVVPVIAGWVVAALLSRTKRSRLLWLILLPAALFWLAFLPNTCYLLTEWRHFLYDPQFQSLHDRADAYRPAMIKVAEWGLFYLAYSGFGMVCFTAAIRPVARQAARRKLHPNLWAAPFFLLVSLGVYMGLIVRLNSWDLIKRPGYVWDVAVGAMTNPTLLKVIGGFALLLWLGYFLMDAWADGLTARLQKMRLLAHATRSEA